MGDIERRVFVGAIGPRPPYNLGKFGFRTFMLTPGVRFGPYEIGTPVGSGGMGEVYRAHDAQLDRTVALKVLPPTLTADTQALQRCEREARAIAAPSEL